MESNIGTLIERFLNSQSTAAERIYNERALQLELAFFLRANGQRTEFERPFTGDSLQGHTRRQKRDLDLLITTGDESSEKIAVELKVPLAGRVPETMYDFCADIAFIESLVRQQVVRRGFCLLITNDHNFWRSRGIAASLGLYEGIYDYFRVPEKMISGVIQKPTGAKDSSVVVSGTYGCAKNWKKLANQQLMNDARYLFIEIGAQLTEKIGSPTLTTADNAEV